MGGIQLVGGLEALQGRGASALGLGDGAQLPLHPGQHLVLLGLGQRVGQLAQQLLGLVGAARGHQGRGQVLLAPAASPGSWLRPARSARSTARSGAASGPRYSVAISASSGLRSAAGAPRRPAPPAAAPAGPSRPACAPAPRRPSAPRRVTGSASRAARSDASTSASDAPWASSTRLRRKCTSARSCGGLGRRPPPSPACSAASAQALGRARARRPAPAARGRVWAAAPAPSRWSRGRCRRRPGAGPRARRWPAGEAISASASRWPSAVARRSYSSMRSYQRSSSLQQAGQRAGRPRG